MWIFLKRGGHTHTPEAHIPAQMCTLGELIHKFSTLQNNILNISDCTLYIVECHQMYQKLHTSLKTWTQMFLDVMLNTLVDHLLGPITMQLVPWRWLLHKWVLHWSPLHSITFHNCSYSNVNHGVHWIALNTTPCYGTAASSMCRHPALWRPHGNWQLLSGDVLHKQLGRSSSSLTLVTELAPVRHRHNLLLGWIIRFLHIFCITKFTFNHNVMHIISYNSY